MDSGLERRGAIDTATGGQRLETVMASQASATQRAGRAGRTSPGVCHRLWSESGHARRAAHWQAEIHRADLAPLVLELGLWGAAGRRRPRLAGTAAAGEHREGAGPADTAVPVGRGTADARRTNGGRPAGAPATGHHARLGRRQRGRPSRLPHRRGAGRSDARDELGGSGARAERHDDLGPGSAGAATRAPARPPRHVTPGNRCPPRCCWPGPIRTGSPNEGPATRPSTAWRAARASSCRPTMRWRTPPGWWWRSSAVRWSAAAHLQGDGAGHRRAASTTRRSASIPSGTSTGTTGSSAWSPSTAGCWGN